MARRLVFAGFVCCVLIFLPAAASAEDVPKWEAFGGFSYFRAETAPELDVLGVGHMNTFGWHGSISDYPVHWFGATFDFSGAYGQPTLTIPANYLGPGVPETDQNIKNAIKTSAHTFMFGPSFAYRRHPNVKAFAHVLLGGLNGRSSLTSSGEMLVGYPVTSSDWVFGYAVGGGFDVKMAKRVGLRMQGDLIRSTFQDGGNDWQNNIRVSVGLVFRLGD